MYAGIVVIRILPPRGATIISALDNLLTVMKDEHEFVGKLIILEPAGFRINKESE